jgi:hypothetical protein
MAGLPLLKLTALYFNPNILTVFLLNSTNFDQIREANL